MASSAMSDHVATSSPAARPALAASLSTTPLPSSSKQPDAAKSKPRAGGGGGLLVPTRRRPRHSYSFDPVVRARTRRRFQPAQVAVMLRAYQRNPRSGRDVWEALSAETGMTPQDVKIWFQNRRAKENRERGSAAAAAAATAASAPTSASVSAAVGLPDAAPSGGASARSSVTQADLAVTSQRTAEAIEALLCFSTPMADDHVRHVPYAASNYATRTAPMPMPMPMPISSEHLGAAAADRGAPKPVLPLTIPPALPLHPASSAASFSPGHQLPSPSSPGKTPRSSDAGVASPLHAAAMPPPLLPAWSSWSTASTASSPYGYVPTRPLRAATPPPPSLPPINAFLPSPKSASMETLPALDAYCEYRPQKAPVTPLTRPFHGGHRPWPLAAIDPWSSASTLDAGRAMRGPTASSYASYESIGNLTASSSDSGMSSLFSTSMLGSSLLDMDGPLDPLQSIIRAPYASLPTSTGTGTSASSRGKAIPPVASLLPSDGTGLLSGISSLGLDYGFPAGPTRAGASMHPAALPPLAAGPPLRPYF
ncbi:hypothetical protein CXG81DRAFT_16418 [Caulochytrium protostelioides]|uniref:Homeobox domain-containing protein n=1 Tax=Caulochytrium protostelioides TaxID=1555241 RepID=A0A4P9XF05_9FUNG|nr:hypothetical protein CXG81DRAFT_16418 [Caulochytrium protostelioides]|eukprot:RKP04134.1 hypothetical protein CXG81DRAFT_16418 [Caulochytrium protostelioides]